MTTKDQKNLRCRTMLTISLQREAQGVLTMKSRKLNNKGKASTASRMLHRGNSAATVNKTYVNGNPQGKVDYKQLLPMNFQDCVDMDDEGFFCVDVPEDKREKLSALLLLVGCIKSHNTNLMSATYTHPSSGQLVATLSEGDYRREDGTAGWLDCQDIADILKQETDNV